ncbi:lipopolysaccharide-induced tumor necrosis factor-alpha factor-like [Aphidius gifuensis]|uniref:lipopolysaccharide-induced tumor necrosis factor-alpha factor-like n=1 Tax=Aphidius gifuensis TaxID=684658 RepID=UPI001CDCEAC9|nr:lipopolysaccharide-induced tumor necrosis factor-alpha factor-like [Aphidius gifuensis]
MSKPVPLHDEASSPVDEPIPESSTTTILSESTNSLNTEPVGPDTMFCPHCSATFELDQAVYQRRSDPLVGLGVLKLWTYGLICGCCLIPLCVDRCQGSDLVCPNCHLLGFYRKTN